MLPVLETLHLWDGLVNMWPTCLGKEFQAHNDKIVSVEPPWLKLLCRLHQSLPCFQVGAQPPKTDSDLAFDPEPDAQKTRAFLDQQLSIRGRHTVVYIA